MTSSEKPWPRYIVGPRETIFTVGVIALNFNRLEIAFRSLFAAVTETPMQQTQFLFPRIANNVRLDLMKQSLEARSLEADVSERVAHFCKAFNVCAENRNAVMHSHYLGYAASLNGDESAPLRLYKFSRSGSVLECYATIDDLRRVADETQTLINFTLSLAANVPCPFYLPHTEPRDGPVRQWPVPDIPTMPADLKFEPHMPIDLSRE